MNNSSQYLNKIKTCAECPLAFHLGGVRYRCEAEYRIGLEVVRGHWEVSIDCAEPIKEKLNENS